MMIRLEQVTKRYGEKVAVDSLSLEIEAGEVCVLIGPSGCGKTTTLRMINRLTEPTSGHIYVDGHDTATVRPEELRLSMGYAIQSVGLFPHLTVAQNIAVVPQLKHWTKTRIAARTEELLRLVGLDPAAYSGKYPRQLSGGEAQRIGVARALAADPPILLMDEPFGAVDPLTRERLQRQFARIQQTLRKTVILVTHDLDEAIRLATRLAVMEAGRLVQYDRPEAVLANPANRFVRNFVGADRALKRLARIGIKEFIKSAPSIVIDTPVAEALTDHPGLPLAVGRRRSEPAARLGGPRAACPARPRSGRRWTRASRRRSPCRKRPRFGRRSRGCSGRGSSTFRWSIARSASSASCRCATWRRRRPRVRPDAARARALDCAGGGRGAVRRGHRQHGLVAGGVPGHVRHRRRRCSTRGRRRWSWSGSTCSSSASRARSRSPSGYRSGCG